MIPTEDVASTIPSADSGTEKWEVRLRATSMGLMVVLVLVCLSGFFGVRTSVASEADNGFSIAVDHASVTRPGLATPFSVSVSAEAGVSLPEQLTIRIDSRYLAMFDENGLDPTPVSSFRTIEWTWWTFQVPDDARQFELSFDARLEPAVQWGRPATVALEVDGAEMVGVDFTTWVMP